MQKHDPFYDFLALLISGLGFSLDPPAFLASLLLALAGATITRMFTPERSRKALALSLCAGVFVALMLMSANRALMDHGYGGFPQQLVAGVGGFMAVAFISWFNKSFPALADRIAERMIGKGQTDAND